MAVDVVDLIPSLKREIAAPGETVADLNNSEWIGHLTDAFWEARLHGLLSDYTEESGLIESIDPSGSDLPREMQQLIVLYAGFRIAITSYRNLNSSFRAKSGPVEYEVQKSAQTLKSLLDTIKGRIDLVLRNLSSYDTSTSVAVFDSVIEASYALALEPSGSSFVGG